MKKLILLVVLCFAATLSMQSQKKNQERRSKKNISKLISKIKKIEDRDKKEEVLTKVLDKINDLYGDADLDELTKTQQAELDHTLTNLNKGFELVQGGTAQELNDYAEFMESEFNQSDVFLIVLGIGLLFFALFWWGMGGV